MKEAILLTTDDGSFWEVYYARIQELSRPKLIKLLDDNERRVRLLKRELLRRKEAKRWDNTRIRPPIQVQVPEDPEEDDEEEPSNTWEDDIYY